MTDAKTVLHATTVRAVQSANRAADAKTVKAANVATDASAVKDVTDVQAVLTVKHVPMHITKQKRKILETIKKERGVEQKGNPYHMPELQKTE